MGYVAIFLYLITISSLYTIVLKKNSNITLPCSLLTTTLITVLFSLVTDNIRLSFLLINIIYLSIGLLYFFWTIHAKRVKEYFFEYIHCYFNIPTLIFSLLFIFICVVHCESNITTYDEIAFWSPLTREMYFNNTYHFHLSSEFCGSVNYPPYFQTLELIFLFLFRGGFKENILYIALSVFTLDLFLMAYNENKDKNLLYNGCFVLIFIFSNLSHYVIEHSSFDKFTSIFESIQLDQMLGLVPAVGMFYIITDRSFENFDRLYLVLLISAVVLTKQISIALALMVVFLYFIKKILMHDKITKEDAILIIPFFVWALWKFGCSYYLSLENCNNFSGVMEGITVDIVDKDVNFYSDVTAGFIDALIYSPIITVGVLKMNYIVINILVLISVFIIVNTHLGKKSAISISVTYLIGFIGYAATIYVLYLSVFSVQEALLTASYERFMGSFVYLGITLLIMLILKLCFNSPSILVLTLLITLAMTNIENIKLLDCHNRFNYKNDFKYKELFSQYDTYILSSDSKSLLIVSQEYEPFLEVYLEYEFDGVNIDIYSLDRLYAEEFATNTELIKQEFVDKCNENDYIYIFQYDDLFYDLVWKDSENEYLLNDRMYEKENGKLKLVPWITSE